MNKDTPSRMLLNTEDDAFKSEAPCGHTKEAVENVGLEPRVEGQLLGLEGDGAELRRKNQRAEGRAFRSLSSSKRQGRSESGK